MQNASTMSCLLVFGAFCTTACGHHLNYSVRSNRPEELLAILGHGKRSDVTLMTQPVFHGTSILNETLECRSLSYDGSFYLGPSVECQPEEGPLRHLALGDVSRLSYTDKGQPLIGAIVGGATGFYAGWKALDGQNLPQPQDSLARGGVGILGGLTAGLVGWVAEFLRWDTITVEVKRGP